ncbi:MAG: antibiotic biosynthesis monooxygenase [Rubrobacter sp.]|nr:antibiotic biosynthesis monooxygenase [Rubrobacter sp.]
MSDGRVTVVARVKAKSGMEERLAEAMGRLLEGSRSDAGCVNYDLHRGLEDPSVFVIYENWTSERELDEHLDQPHLHEFVGKLEDLAEGEIEITRLEMISSPTPGTAGQ